MGKITFKAGSEVHKMHMHFSAGGSWTADEAHDLYKDDATAGVNRLTQRMPELKKKFEKAEHESPLMVLDEMASGGRVFARYFYKGCNCFYEGTNGARSY